MPRSSTREKAPQKEPSLPPEEAWLWRPEDGLLDTPVDDWGLVDLDELVQIALETVDPEYDWTSPFNDIHHLQWPKRQYAKSTTKREFREQTQRKAYLPRRLHNWIHFVTAPPPVPSYEAMRHSIAAEKVARELAVTAQRAFRLTQVEGMPDARLERLLREAFDAYTIHVKNARQVPRELQIVKTEEIRVRSVEEMLEVGRRLGSLALRVPAPQVA